jgi:hypothetical protein
MTDDDLLKRGAVAAVLDALRRDVSLVIVNAEIMDMSMSRVIQPRWIHFDADRVYGPGDMDRLLIELDEGRNYAGGVIIKRSIWIAREKECYYGSSFVFLGVIFQERLPGDAIVIAKPLISYRFGNVHTFSHRMFETYLVKLPALVRSMAVSETAKDKVCDGKTWRDSQDLLLWRGRGIYSVREYRQWIRPTRRSMHETLIPGIIALTPGVIANAILVLYYTILRRPFRGVWEPKLVLQALKESPFYFRNLWLFKRGS